MGISIVSQVTLPEVPLEPYQVYDEAVKYMEPDEIDHHGNGKGFDDLYLKVTPMSNCIVDRLSNKSLLSMFRSNIDGSLWYNLPFCYPVVEEEWA